MEDIEGYILENAKLECEIRRLQAGLHLIGQDYAKHPACVLRGIAAATLAGADLLDGGVAIAVIEGTWSKEKAA